MIYASYVLVKTVCMPTPRDRAYEMLYASIGRFIALTNEDCKCVNQLFRYRKLGKKEHLFQQGEIFQDIIFGVSGCFRTYVIKNGAERTGMFCFEEDWYTDYESWLTKQPSIINIDILASVELLVASFRDLENLYLENPKFERVGRLLAEDTIITIRNRNVSLLNDSPEERYLKLLKEKPKVIACVPQHMIASYLGIEPETLSRIRKKLALQGK